MKIINNYFHKALIPVSGLLTLSACGNTETTKEKPNIILILADDMGYSDLGCYGSEIKTPNLDKLAQEGMRFTNFYNAGRSCPSRASLLTGLYPTQAGIGDMDRNDSIQGYNGFLNNTCATLGEVLQHNGYSTYMSGKWHVGSKDTTMWPLQRGFDKYFGLLEGATSYYDNQPYRNNRIMPLKIALGNQLITPDSGFYMTDKITQFAIENIENHDSKKPFFQYIAYTAPHWPLHALPEDIEKYRGKYMKGWDSVRVERYQKLLQLGIIDSNTKLSARDEKIPAWETLSDEEKKTWDLRMAVYAAMIDRMDQGIGKIIQSLKEKNLDHNTVIIFLSDNGGCHERVKCTSNYICKTGETGTPNSFDAYEYNWANVSNTPFRMFKHWTHEGGISTPFIAWYPQMIASNQINHTTQHIINIMPTFIEMASGKYPETLRGNKLTKLAGHSLVPTFKNTENSDDAVYYWEHEGNRAIRKGCWKLVSSFDKETRTNNQWELYNLKNDRSETKNLASEIPNTTELLEKWYFEMAKNYGTIPYQDILTKRENK